MQIRWLHIGMPIWAELLWLLPVSSPTSCRPGVERHSNLREAKPSYNFETVNIHDKTKTLPIHYFTCEHFSCIHTKTLGTKRNLNSRVQMYFLKHCLCDFFSIYTQQQNMRKLRLNTNVILNNNAQKPNMTSYVTSFPYIRTNLYGTKIDNTNQQH